ncbi:TIR domain-containing protein [Dactylosporangium sp. NBC_01737]|uniref:TIR domain-containing protein n=1 Tax=Dactylosporangium sp. NBC_01737 TaxID=2975959 RepID=UPI002E0E8EB5|nr:TIR domain-containing protein [Dactylosporangium sp. NBC_01737]
MTRVFISHAAADATPAARLATRLAAAGVAVFLLEWVEPGLVTVLEQEHALTTATHGLLLISRATMADPAVREEYAALVGHARTGAGRRFVPVLVGDITDADLPRFAAIRQPVDLRTPDAYDDRVAALLRVLQRPGSGAPAGDFSWRPPGLAAGDRIRILLLAANPRGTGPLAIDVEEREITEKLRLSRDRDRFDLVTCWAVRPSDLLQHLNRHTPQIVHFSGHGRRPGEIVLAADDGTGRLVDAAALGELFRVTGNMVRVVVLNACWSAVQAQAIGQHVDYVLGMRKPVTDQATTVLAAAFYSALGFGRTVPEAFEQATAALLLHGLAEQDTPELLIRHGADPHLSTPH